MLRSKTFRTSWLRTLISGGLALLLLPASLQSDCTPGGDPGPYTYRFIDPVVLGYGSQLAPYLMAFDELYRNYFEQTAQLQQQDNVTEWRERFCKAAPLADIREVVYSDQVGYRDLERLLAGLDIEDATLGSVSPILANNRFARYLFRHQCRETIRYLAFAKRCEPHVTTRNPWENDFQDAGAMRNLIQEGRAEFVRTESHYIRLRYAYQLVRLAHYLEDYDLTLELYDYLMPKVDADPSLIYFWIEGHRAGALQAKGLYAEAAYIYSRVFDRCPSKRRSAYLSFRVRNDEEWEQVFKLCRNDHERATLYVLRAQADDVSGHVREHGRDRESHLPEPVDGRLIEEIRNIYAIEPDNPALEALLVREMQQLEKDFLGLQVNPRRLENRRLYQVPRPGAERRLIDLSGFVRKAAQEGRVAHPELWEIARGYLEMLSGDYYYAAQAFSRAAERVSNDSLAEQLSVFRTALQIISTDSVGVDVERQYFRLSRRDRFNDYPDLRKLMNDKLRRVYQQTGEIGKAFLMEYGLDDLRLNPDIEIIDNLLALTEKSDLTAFEEELLTNRQGNSIRPQLLDIKATYFLQQTQLEAAYEIFQEIPDTEWDTYGLYSPFVDRINDCVHCPFPDSMPTYNKGELMERIIQLDYDARAETNTDLAARNYFLLGLAFYNMTYFGPNWRVADYFRSGSSGRRAYLNRGRTVFDYPGMPLGNREFFDVNRAKYYFDLARVRAQNPELAARAAFWAAKCERNEYYTKGPANSPRGFTNFQILVDQYANTRYYQELIEECATFRAFAQS